jgi:pSer/pThr/pTyr-binding forkhead associated (FHA) protein
MKVLLKALSHPEIGDIRIDDSLFAIGRQEPPFSAHANPAVAKLSRRHARIFEQDGHYFLVDTGSLNGTRLNGKAVDQQAARLRHGDEVCFAGQLQFRVELQQQAPQEAPSVRLSLKPCDAGSGLDTLVISRFPFLISQTEGAFARYRDSHGDALGHLSRRHAHIFLRHGQPQVEDLGSTNGTFVGDQRLDEHPVALHDGDTLTFGCPTFRYGTELTAADQPAPLTRAAPATAGAGADEPRTTFITSASPFLDIFCQQQDAPSQDVNAPETDARAAASDAPRSRLVRMRVFLGELRRALGLGDKPRSAKTRWLTAALLLLLTVAALLIYQHGAEEREIRALMAQARYAEASQRASRYFERQPGQREIEALASEALLMGSVPGWQQQLVLKAYDAALEQLEVAAIGDIHPQGRQLLALLGWVTELDRFFTRRPPGNDLELYHHEQQIRALLEHWQDQGSDARRLLDQVRDQVPAFAPVHSRTFSQLRQLEYESTVYLQAIDALDQRLRKLLEDNDSEALTALLDGFQQKYPNIQGIERLRLDLEDFETLQRAIGQHDLDTLQDLEQRLVFRTPPFVQAGEALLQRNAPPAAIVELHRQAREAWLAGESQRAITLLESGVAQSGGATLAPQLARYRDILNAYRQLQVSEQSADYGPMLIGFYDSLDPAEDRHYRDALAQAFRHYADEARRDADQAMANAGDYWQQYQQQGGIGSALRLENNVSERFRQQAKLLNRAHDQARLGMSLYGLLEQAPAAATQALERKIANEVQGQRQWLQDLSTVLDPLLLRTKLQLLTAPDEEAP